MSEPQTLQSLLGDEGAVEPATILGVTADSRAVQRGYLFAALPGHKVDGRDYIGDAVSRGCAAVLSTSNDHSAFRGLALPTIRVAEPRQKLAEIAARFYQPQPRHLVAVTGTNGKTSVADFTRQIWHALALKAASLGTLGLIKTGDDSASDIGGATTSDPVTLHRALHRLKADGIDHVVFEASSHGLDQYRLDGCRFKVAGFTNLSRDHLDYHGTEEAYLDAKTRLFTDLLASKGMAVLFGNDARADHVAHCAQQAGKTILRVGHAETCDWVIKAVQHGAQGQRIELDIKGVTHRISLPLIGQFQLHNWLVAAAMVWALGADLKTVLSTAPAMKGVAGRMEQVGQTKTGALVLIDYAHTPDGLETVLTAARPYAKGRLSVLFGCGGDRDSGKRSQMGAIAARLADRVVVTDDNPRSEDPATIRQMIMSACPGACEIADRSQAIEHSIQALQAGDLLIIAGKGHETGQHIGDTIHPFSDLAAARSVLNAFSGRKRGV